MAVPTSSRILTKEAADAVVRPAANTHRSNVKSYKDNLRLKLIKKYAKMNFRKHGTASLCATDVNLKCCQETRKRENVEAEGCPMSPIAEDNESSFRVPPTWRRRTWAASKAPSLWRNKVQKVSQQHVAELIEQFESTVSGCIGSNRSLNVSGNFLSSVGAHNCGTSSVPMEY